jgi:D-tyrosyl-tRNA(Tyr) deacylase
MEAMDKQIKDVFKRFPGVQHVFVDKKGVHLNRRKGADRVSRKAVKTSGKPRKKNANK